MDQIISAILQAFLNFLSLYLESKSSPAPLCKLTSKHWHLLSLKDACYLKPESSDSAQLNKMLKLPCVCG